MAGTDERKPVTVLFADLAGSTELVTRHDPEHLRALGTLSPTTPGGRSATTLARVAEFGDMGGRPP
jgi:hypothetical protein